MNGLTKVKLVTILILIDGFLQFVLDKKHKIKNICHNPYFNRWFSAIKPLRDSCGLKTRSQSLF